MNHSPWLNVLVATFLVNLSFFQLFILFNKQCIESKFGVPCNELHLDQYPHPPNVSILYEYYYLNYIHTITV